MEQPQEYWRIKNSETGRVYAADRKRFREFHETGDPKTLIDVTNEKLETMPPPGGAKVGIVEWAKQGFRPGIDTAKIDPMSYSKIIHPIRTAVAVKARVVEESFDGWKKAIEGYSDAEVMDAWSRRDENHDAVEAGEAPTMAGLTPREVTLYDRLQVYYDATHGKFAIPGYRQHYVPRNASPKNFPDIRSAAPGSANMKTRIGKLDPERYSRNLNHEVRRYLNGLANARYLTPALEPIRIRLAMAPREVSESFSPFISDILGQKTSADVLAEKKSPNVRAASEIVLQVIHSNVLGSPAVAVASKLGASAPMRAFAAALPVVGNAGVTIVNSFQTLWGLGAIGVKRLASAVLDFGRDPEGSMAKARQLGALEHTYESEYRSEMQSLKRQENLNPVMAKLGEGAAGIAQHSMAAFSDVETFMRTVFANASYKLGREVVAKYDGQPNAVGKILKAIGYRQYRPGELQVLIDDLKARDHHGFARDLSTFIIDNNLYVFGRQNQSGFQRALHEKFPQFGNLLTQFWSFSGNTLFTMLPKKAGLTGGDTYVRDVIRGAPAPGNAAMRVADAAYFHASRGAYIVGGLAALYAPLWLASTAMKYGAGVNLDDRIFFNWKDILARRPGPGGQALLAFIAAGAKAAQGEPGRAVSELLSDGFNSVAAVALPRNFYSVIDFAVEYATGDENKKGLRDRLEKYVSKMTTEQVNELKTLLPGAFDREGNIVYQQAGKAGRDIVYNRDFADMVYRMLGMNSVPEAEHRLALSYARELSSITQEEQSIQRRGGSIPAEAYNQFRAIKTAFNMDVDRFYRTISREETR